MIDPKIWAEQDAFNTLLRDLPREEDQITEFLRDMGLNLMSEVDELLRTTTWKKHRKDLGHRPNRDHRMEECVDLFKLWLTVVQGLGFTPYELQEMYWRKSMVVRQRHSEEWVKKLDRPAVVIDIDNVLCDYTSGLCDWMSARFEQYTDIIDGVRKARPWLNASSFSISEQLWQSIKHQFRTSGGKRTLPVMQGAQEFLKACRDAGYYIVLLTSRPVARYPNIYTDTLWWLDKHGMMYDWLWWATDKGERLLESDAVQHIKLVVDDDRRYVEQFARLGLNVWWLQTTGLKETFTLLPQVHVAHTLRDVIIPRLQEGV